MVNCLLVLFAFLCVSHSGSAEVPRKDTGLCRRILVSPDRENFLLEKTGQVFHPWGMNYGHYGVLAKNFDDPEWDTLVSDFRTLKAMGANVVRVHLQYDEFMRSAEQPDPQAVAGFKRLLEIARNSGLYLDITGLAAYRPAGRPAWYDAMDESDRWEAQSLFWSAVARAGAGDPAIFCYDLINEPIIPAKARASGDWYTGRLGEFDFGQYLTLDPKERSKNRIGYEWIDKMTTAIRKIDSQSLITVGFLPWESAAFIDTVSACLDFISTHIYPQSGHTAEAIGLLTHFKAGIPVVIEETFPLACDTAELAAFMRESRETATGWMGHYLMSSSLEALQAKPDKSIVEIIYLGWLEMFIRMKPGFSPAPIDCR